MTSKNLTGRPLARWARASKSGLIAAFAALVMLPAAVSAAQALAAPVAADKAAGDRPLDRQDLEAWLDGYVPFALRRGDIAGAVVVVVKDGQVLLKKGYGYADVATLRPVDPDRTLFRPGSVSKLFTWTAVMQLVEAGRLDLDRDVNDYLDFKIPPRDGQPVTMRNLMTHTPGFEDALDNLIVMDPAVAPSLERYVKHHIPARIYPAGQVPAYSNYGVALAGYIVQRLSGLSFDDYMQARILTPLGMQQASFRQPLPEAFRQHLSSGYERASAGARPYEIAVGPAGNAAVTAADMARFMTAHLQGGELEGRRILSAATAQAMHGTPLALIHPALPHMSLGFFQGDRNGHRVIGHDGDTFFFHSVLQLYPDDHVGLFLSINSAGHEGGARALRAGLVDGFADRYFGRAPAAARVGGFDARADLASMTGAYQHSLHAEENFLSLLGLFTQERVQDDGQGHLIASSALGLNGEPRRFEEIAPWLWREVGGQGLLAAQVVDRTVVAWAEGNEAPAFAFVPVSPWRNATWLAPALAAAMAVLLLTTLAWPIDATLQRRRGGTVAGAAAWLRSWRLTRIAAVAAGGLMLAWLGLIAYMFTALDISSTLEPVITALHVLSIAVFPAAWLLALWHLRQALRAGPARAGTFLRGWSALLAVALGITLWVAVAFKLIGLTAGF